MRCSRYVLLLAWAIQVSTCIAAEDPKTSLVSVVQSEIDFARAVAEKGIRDAFLAYLAEDSVLFRPGPVAGRKWYEERPPAKGVLSWHPSVARVAASGDLAYTTGPWEFRADSAKAEPDATGIYVTVWKRQADKSWKAVIDAGVGTTTAQKLPPFDPSASGPANRGSSGGPTQPAEHSLLTADQDFFSRAASEAGRAYSERGAADMVLVREAAGLVSGRDAAVAVLTGSPVTLNGQPLKGIVSAAGDLGYTYGPCEFKATMPGGVNRQGHYLRIWRRGDDGKWTIALDLLCPMPPPAPSPAP